MLALFGFGWHNRRNNRSPAVSNLDELSREQLYERVWSTPGSTLATEMGISDVALAKRCKKLNVPRPPRGYWARLTAGKKLRKPSLPPGLTNSTAAKMKGDPQSESSPAAITPSYHLPATNHRLHPAAQDLLTALRAATPDNEHRMTVEGPTYPRVTISKKLADRAAKALHVIILAAEARTVPFRKSRSKYDYAYFERGKSNDRLRLDIEEEIVTIKKEPTAQDKRRPSWEWQTRTRELSGKLTFLIRLPYEQRKDVGKWSEEDETPIEQTLEKVVDGICQHYADLEKHREEEAVKRRKEHEEYELRQQEEAKRKHSAELENSARARAEDLLKAAEWWRLHRSVREFIDECERSWREGQNHELLEDQVQWLSWAREISRELSPAEKGYPDPSRDGAFDPDSVLFGGPYPSRRDFPRPPTMPKIPPPVVQQSGYSSHVPEVKPYPFWLRYQR